MKLFIRLLFVLFVITAFFGLAAGLFSQMELLKPGVKFADYDLMAPVFKTHAVLMSIAFPILLFCITTIALILPLAKSKVYGSLWVVCIFLSVAFPLIFVLLISLVEPFEKKVYESVAIIGILLVGLFVQSVFLSSRIKSASVKIYTMIALMPLLPILLLMALMRSSILAVDTYLMTALSHAAGVALICLSFAHFAIWIERDAQRLKFGVSFLHALLIVIFGLAMVFFQFRLGLVGSPRGYHDYPKAFAHWQYLSSIAGFALMFLIIAGMVRVIIASREPDTSAKLF